ncbi:hypothetical protein BDY21DRAFT_257149, partial [Lineolata rhizophorae]
PQKDIDAFWAKFNSKHPGKAFTVLPDNSYARRAAQLAPRGVVPGQNALASYERAVLHCCRKVDKIVRECRRINQKYRDPHFDIEADFRLSMQGVLPDCLTALCDNSSNLRPMSVKRVEDIFEDPKFFIEGASANDIRQGNEGDCWFMSALCTLSNGQGLIRRVCVACDEQVGVYGFVFHRDGEWFSEIVDDKLYLIKEDFDEATVERHQWLAVQNRKNPEEEYRAVMQTGSRALYFAQCADPNETWLPLLEKAYAKSHGDYAAINGGFVGEGIEDLTGGVTTEIFATDILDKDKFWKDELMNVNKTFLFGCGQMGGKHGERKGIQEKHAYSIMEARELDGHRLLKLRNPWGRSEWQGKWSDGSEEWTPERMEKLNHKFGDDGVFWISYKDLLTHYQHFDRTRLFGPEWTVTQQWTSVQVPWTVDYLDTKFNINLSAASPVVIVLSQLDDRYFIGLEGQYSFQLSFRLHKDDEDDYIVRSNKPYFMKRSVSTELDLEAGSYTVLLKITATRNPHKPTPERVIRSTCTTRREKLLAIGLSYDLAHAKGQFRELEREARHREQRERKERQKRQLKKMHDARRKQHKKDKLRQIRKNMKIAEKLERSSAAASGTATPVPGQEPPGPPPAAILDRRIEDLRVSEPEPLHGLGIQSHGAEGDGTGTPPQQAPSGRPGVSPLPNGNGNASGPPTSSSVATNASTSTATTTSSTVTAATTVTNGSTVNGVTDSPGLPAQNASRPGSPFSRPSSVPIGDNPPRSAPPPPSTFPPVQQQQQQQTSRPHGRSASVTAPMRHSSPAPPTVTNGTAAARRATSPAPPSAPLPVRRDTLSAVPGVRPGISVHKAPRHMPEAGFGFGGGSSVGGSSIRLSDVSDDDLSWDSELDAPSSSEGESEGEEAAAGKPSSGGPDAWMRGMMGEGGPDDAGDDAEDEFERDPWNAVCVVGLRVFSADARVNIEVARRGERVGRRAQRRLDVDDSAADASKRYR